VAVKEASRRTATPAGQAYDWGVSDLVYVLMTLAVLGLLALLAGFLDRRLM